MPTIVDGFSATVQVTGRGGLLRRTFRDCLLSAQVYEQPGPPATGFSDEWRRIKALAEAGDPLDNMAWAIRQADYYGEHGLHSEVAQDAVLRLLEMAIAQGGSYAEIQARLKKTLGYMREVLENGGKFW